MECYSAIKKSEIMPFVAPWIDLEIIILSEGRERQISYGMAYHMESKNMIQMNLFIKRNRPTNLEKNLQLPKEKCGVRNKLGIWE